MSYIDNDLDHDDWLDWQRPRSLEELYQEAMDYEANAGFDYVSEAFGATARDCDDFAREEARQDLFEARVEIMDDMEARGGPRLRDAVIDDYVPF